MNDDRRRRPWRALDRVSWLDVKLGVRMLAKYPALSIVAVLGMALAIAIGGGYFAFIGAMLDSTLPFAGGDRVVVIENRYVSGPDAGDTTRASTFDFAEWRGALRSVDDLGAFRDESFNLIAGDGTPQPVRAAAMTASGFRLTGVAAQLGRTLLDEDERPGAPPVLVIGYDEWQRRFDGDARILGRTVRLGETVHSIVGVMPAGFGFPIRHGYWVPLHMTAGATDPAATSSIYVFGRLAKGVSAKDANAELKTVGERMAAAFPQTHRDMRPQALAYTPAFLGLDGPEMELAMRSIQLGVGLLLVIVAVNVAIVVYARTATRMGEIAVRTAIGASRARVVTQLFVEALVLSATSAAIGLTVVSVLLGRMGVWLRGSLDAGDKVPYWIDFGVSPGLVVYVAALALLAGVIVGVLPALKATGKRVHAGLEHLTSRGSSMRLGRTWTALVVAQVAITVAILPAAMYNASASLRTGMSAAAPAAREMVRGVLATSWDDASWAGGAAAAARAGDPRWTAKMTALLQRLEAEPGVAGATFAHRFPGEEWPAAIEVENAGGGGRGTGAQLSTSIRARTNQVAPNLFELFDVPILAGRGFTAADALPGATTVLVDQPFAARLGGAGRVIGRRVRYASQQPDGSTASSPWSEIVGVVPAFADAFTAPTGIGPPLPRLYHAAAPGQVYPASLMVRLKGGDAARSLHKLREVTATVDSTLKLERVATMAQARKAEIRAFWMLAVGIIGITLSVLLLSAAGIYAMMSFTVSRRGREIGIRAALGADSRRVVSAIFGRACAQLGAGVAAGLAVAAAVEWLGPGGTMGGNALVILPSVVALMTAVGLLATLGPARRGLAVQPTEALRGE